MACPAVGNGVEPMQHKPLRMFQPVSYHILMRAGGSSSHSSLAIVPVLTVHPELHQALGDLAVFQRSACRPREWASSLPQTPAPQKVLNACGQALQSTLSVVPPLSHHDCQRRTPVVLCYLLHVRSGEYPANFPALGKTACEACWQRQGSGRNVGAHMSCGRIHLFPATAPSPSSRMAAILRTLPTMYLCEYAFVLYSKWTGRPLIWHFLAPSNPGQDLTPVQLLRNFTVLVHRSIGWLCQATTSLIGIATKRMAWPKRSYQTITRVHITSADQASGSMLLSTLSSLPNSPLGGWPSGNDSVFCGLWHRTQVVLHGDQPAFTPTTDHGLHKRGNTKRQTPRNHVMIFVSENGKHVLDHRLKGSKSV